MRESKVEVLVVGAGPVGMLTALLLTEAGVAVEIIDAEPGRSSKSYACALHPRTLQLLDSMGLLQEVLEAGRRIDSMGFYDRQSRRARLNFNSLPGEHPFAVIVPQGVLEGLLEARLRSRGQMEIKWSHRLAGLEQDADGVSARVDQLKQTAKGYIVPTWEWMVNRTIPYRASYVVGADGHFSLTRKLLGIECVSTGSPLSLEVFEFETSERLKPEARVVMDEQTVNVCWPITENRCRWSFQISDAKGLAEFPHKDRSAVIIDDPEANQEFRQRLDNYLKRRAPWFEPKARLVDWGATVRFEPQVARQFGENRCWLAGDAAHQASPVGVHSMNLGFREAESLAHLLRDILRDGGSRDRLTVYSRARLTEWEQLLGLKGEAKSLPEADPWVRQNARRILPCIPASGADLMLLATQLKFEVPWYSRPAETLCPGA